MKYSKETIIPAAVTALYALLTAWAFWLPFSPTANDPLSGIFASLLSEPWSGIGTSMLDAINPEFLDQGWGLAIMVVGALINAVIIYWATRWIIRKIRS